MEPAEAFMAEFAFCRFVHFFALMLAFGGAAYLLLCAPDALRPALAPAVRPIVLFAAVAGLITAVLWVAFATVSITGDAASAFDARMLATVLYDTEFGRMWIPHLALTGALVLAAFWSSGEWTATTLLGGLTLAGLALVGHAAMQGGFVGLLHRANDAAHLTAAGAWIGGLIPFVLCLGLYVRDKQRQQAVHAMMRFSFYGHFAVAAIVATGIGNAALTTGLPWPPASPYRALLDVKIGVVALMISLALVNRYALVPRIAAYAGALPALRAITLVNVGLGALVVALVSVFGMLDPA